MPPSDQKENRQIRLVFLTKVILPLASLDQDGSSIKMICSSVVNIVTASFFPALYTHFPLLQALPLMTSTCDFQWWCWNQTLYAEIKGPGGLTPVPQSQWLHVGDGCTGVGRLCTKSQLPSSKARQTGV